MSDVTFSPYSGNPSSSTSGATSRGRPAMGVLDEDGEQVDEDPTTMASNVRIPSAMIRSSSSSAEAKFGRGARPLPRSRSPGREKASGSSAQGALSPVTRRAIASPRSPRNTGFGGTRAEPVGPSLSYGPEEQVCGTARDETAHSGTEERRRGSVSPATTSLRRKKVGKGMDLSKPTQLPLNP